MKRMPPRSMWFYILNCHDKREAVCSVDHFERKTGSRKAARKLANVLAPSDRRWRMGCHLYYYVTHWHVLAPGRDWVVAMAACSIEVLKAVIPTLPARVAKDLRDELQTALDTINEHLSGGRDA